MSGDRHIIGQAVYQCSIGKTCFGRVFQINLAVSRTENANGCVPLRDPIAHKWYIARVAERYGVIAKYRPISYLIG